MKQFLVICAILPLLLIIMLQFTLDQINSSKINSATQAVYTAKEKAQIEGYFSDEIKEELALRLQKAGFDDSDIEMSFDSYDEAQDIGTILNYYVCVKINNAMAAFISGDNSYDYVIDSCTLSQYVVTP